MSIRTLELHGEFPTLNEYIRAERGSCFAAAKMKKGWTAIVWAEALAQMLPPVQHYPVKIHCTWRMKDARKDLDNVRFGVKFVLDGLVAAKVLIDDGQQYVAGLSDSFMVDALNPGVTVMIEEAE